MGAQEPGPYYTYFYTLFPALTTSTWLYLRVVKLDLILCSGFNERPVTFEHNFSGSEGVRRCGRRNGLVSIGATNQQRADLG